MWHSLHYSNHFELAVSRMKPPSHVSSCWAQSVRLCESSWIIVGVKRKSYISMTTTAGSLPSWRCEVEQWWWIRRQSSLTRSEHAMCVLPTPHITFDMCQRLWCCWHMWKDWGSEHIKGASHTIAASCIKHGSNQTKQQISHFPIQRRYKKHWQTP